ncbi:hypothetical protein [Inhella gelatinilytica]|uniref:Uncharacterized protein n=1 Tax=Inhella gelatinilytica TaxID=2795030 RepID=A0A931IYV8_9BURK|nr:hypothetical protein [Inhella gelatinilytica]MBH9554141.1 hypothetical protein [Inhella gelatinilytica]
MNALIRGLFLGFAALTGLALVLVGLAVSALLMGVFALRRLVARLLGRPVPQRPARAQWRFHRGTGPQRRGFGPGDVVDAEVREISRSGEGG